MDNILSVTIFRLTYVKGCCEHKIEKGEQVEGIEFFGGKIKYKNNSKVSVGSIGDLERQHAFL